MTLQKPPTWTWEETDPFKSGSSGDLSKLFRHEQAKHPGVLSRAAPPANAVLLAREVIQNSWDAARELQESDPNAPGFEIAFNFDSLIGGSKKSLVDHLGLRGLSGRADVLSRSAVSLRETDCLQSLGDTDPLPILTIVESGTTGMYGPFTGAKSKLYLALVSLGYTEKQLGAGGSYGFGKASLIRGSAIRTVIAYTCFREREDEPAVTRRLLGMTYWGQHDFDGINYTGFARFGIETAAGTRPFENEQADRVAEQLGIQVRDPKLEEDLGSTFMLLEPTVDPDALLAAIERSWWPALEEGLFVASVRAPSGHSQYPRPMRDEVLRSFIRGYELATTPQDNPRNEERRIAFSEITVGGSAYENPGVLGLVADLQGWSYADFAATGSEGEHTEHRSLVALMRSPRMVVEYLDVGRTPPYVRGVFVAGDSIDEVLRRTEPKGHDSWQERSDDGEIEVRATEVAAKVISRIRQNVAKFRNQMKPPVPPPEDVNLPFFDKVIRNVMAGIGKGWNPPVTDDRPISIRLQYRPEAVGKGLVRVVGSASFALSEHHEGTESDLEVSIFYRYLEGDRVGEYSELTVAPAEGFWSSAKSPGVFQGRIERDAEVVFEFASETYSEEWSGRLIANGHLIPSQREELL